MLVVRPAIGPTEEDRNVPQDTYPTRHVTARSGSSEAAVLANNNWSHRDACLVFFFLFYLFFRP